MTSKIEWTNLTWNPVTGCTPISEGCQNCYAQRMHKRLQAMGQVKYSSPFHKIWESWNELHRKFGKKPKMIFVNSMSDLFHDEVPAKFIQQLLWNCRFMPQHTFQILTKRSDRLNETVIYEKRVYEFPENVWLGVSVELAKYKHRIDDLRQTNAKVKFISFEPLLGDVGELDLSGIDWVIVGGESGPGARPMHPDWVRNIREQAIAQGCKFMFKQWGEWQQGSNFAKNYKNICLLNNGDFLNEGKWNASGIGEYLTSKQLRNSVDEWNKLCAEIMAKVGKKKAGRELDGKIWDEFPER